MYLDRNIQPQNAHSDSHRVIGNSKEFVQQSQFFSSLVTVFKLARNNRYMLIDVHVHLL